MDIDSDEPEHAFRTLYENLTVYHRTIVDKMIYEEGFTKVSGCWEYEQKSINGHVQFIDALGGYFSFSFEIF